MATLTPTHPALLPRLLIVIFILILIVLLPASLPPPIQMLTLALSLYFTCKLLTLLTAPALPTPRALAYLFLWIGMDPTPFAPTHTPPRQKPFTPPLPLTLAKILLALLLLAIVPLVFRLHNSDFIISPPLLAAALALFSLILLFHFGLFELLAILWQARRIPVHPLMNRPLLATSLSDFWNHRWNSGFHQLAARFLFRPLARAANPPLASFATFLVSGIIHELVITLPIRSNFGKPTAYFLIQALALHLQRTRPARRLHLNRGPLGRLFTAAATLAPLPLLFPPAFLLQVILPLVTPPSA